MSPRSSPHGAPNDRFRRAKRLSDHLSPNMAPSKRKRSTPDLKDYHDIHQHILLAAAMVLCVPVEKLLSLASFPMCSSENTSSDSLEVSSNSSSNDYVEELTPPESSSSERTMNVTRSRLSRRPRTHSVSIEGLGFAPTHVQASMNHVDDLVPEQGLKGLDTNTSVDLFATGEPYPTPTDSQVSEMLITNNLWQESPVTEFALPAYGTQSAGNHTTALLPSTASLADPNSFSFSGYGAEMPFYANQNLQNFEELDYSSVDWNIPPPNATTASIDLFAPSPSTQPDLKSLPKYSGMKGRRRGPFQAEEQRQETGLTRRIGACIRCSMQRIRCIPDPSSPSGCCKTCIQASQTRTCWLPCLRYKITDTELLAHDVCPRPTWTTRWKKMELIDISTWASSSIKTIECTQGVGDTSYFLKVRKFQPVEGDALCRRWKIDGVEYKYECAPYAVPDMRQAGRTLIDFAMQSLPVAIKSWVDNQDRLLCSTYNMAYNYSLNAEREEDRSLLNATLRMWAASRMMSRAAHICGTETLGMKRRDYGPKSASTNKILLPPVFSAQMEVIFVAMILQPTKKEVLDRLKSLVSENNRRSWLAIYLCIFLLLHSCALLTARDRERAKMQGVQRRFYRPRVIDELHNGAKILLAYFHFCNKGSYPLHMDWTSADQIALSQLKPEQIDFMRETVKEFDRKSAHFRHVLETGAYEDEYYFIAQLYERDWKPRHTV